MRTSYGFRGVKGVVLVLVLAVVSACDLLAQAAVVKRSVVLREGHAKNTTNKGTLHKNDELTLLDPDEVNGYYNVRVADGAEGWVYGAYIRIVAAPPSTTSTSGPSEVYRSCGLEGNAAAEFRRQANTLKNRVTAPTTTDIVNTITVDKIVAPGDDRTRWKPEEGASIVGYVVDVTTGSKETVNCGETDQKYKDTHISLVMDPNDNGENRRLIVEVTPRWRTYVATHGKDWTTPTLRSQLKNHWVRFTGWMFFDGEHDDESENTTPGRAANWRATAWEIHPVTSIALCASGPQNC